VYVCEGGGHERGKNNEGDGNGDGDGDADADGVAVQRRGGAGRLR
jgi:hypothetical protein